MTAGTYHLSATGDDGIRVILDGRTVIDGWFDHRPTTFTTDMTITEGDHTIAIEYYERTGGALAQFSVERT